MTNWVIKVIYASGGHIPRDPDGSVKTYANKQDAVAACEMLNAKRPNVDISYIVVPLEN